MQPSVRQYLGIILLLLCSGLWGLPPTAAGAELAISETTELDFGAVVDRNGAVTIGLSDNVIFDPFGIHVGGTVSTGVYRITGDPFATFSLSVVGTSIGGLSIDSFNTSEGTPPLLNVALGITGSLDLRLSGRVTVNSAQANPGLNQPLFYTISVNYN
ncbi:DUF4402 domain-containing protein [bacterium]|nr:DUF4402 domain-containing protein [bacterium]